MTEAPRGTVTVLFTDLEGSTDLRTRLGDDEAHRLIRLHEDLIRAEIERSEGTEAKALGDGFMVVFSSARHAIECAVAIQRAIEAYNTANPDKPIKVRIGLNTGDVTSEGDDVYGTAVNAAARVSAKAQGGQILIPQVVKELAGMIPGVRVVDRGLFWLKGFPTKWRLFEVIWREKETTETAPRATPRTKKEATDIPRSQLPVVGRAAELLLVKEEVENAAAGSLRVLSVEGEAGIGKTRMLEAAAEESKKHDFSVLQIAADEELRGPFFLFRALCTSTTTEAAAAEAMALEALERACEALAGRGRNSAEGLSAQEQMLHVSDEVTNAIRAIAAEKPLALLLDDVQWADEDSLRLIRYLARTVAAAPILILMTVRAGADSSSAVRNLVADLERMHLARRLTLARFTRTETEQLLRNVLGGDVEGSVVESLHARAEGVPFFIEEFARSYREDRVLQQVGGTWTMTRLSGPKVPASVQSLIERRLAQVPAEDRGVLADAAVLGRRFRLTDLGRVISSIEGGDVSPDSLADTLEAAVPLGIVTELPESASYDFVFTHDQIRATLINSQTRQRRRSVHSAIADMLAEYEDENLAALAHHALQAGDEKRAVDCSIRAAREALSAHAPEEAVRIVDAAKPAAASHEERAELLRLKDEALEMLERGDERVANLSEMAALADAVGDESVKLEVSLRRASAARMTGNFEQAAELATQVRTQAGILSDKSTELLACLELGQTVTTSPLGESYWPLVEVDLNAASEPFERAVELAIELDESSLEAASLRELGVLNNGRAKISALSVLEAGGSFFEVMLDEAVQGHFKAAKGNIEGAIKIYNELGDKRGEMSSLIALAYSHVVELTRRGEAGRIEQVRRLHGKLDSMVSESERALTEAKMLYSVHVYARGRLHPDLALARGREAAEKARAIGDRGLEYLSSGGVALVHISLGELDEAGAWIARAEEAALASRGPVLTRRLEEWKGVLAAAHGDSEEAVEHFEAAVKLANERGSPAGAAESLALMAIECAKLGEASGDVSLLGQAGEAAEKARALIATLPGNTPWEAQAYAADALSALVQEDQAAAASAARSALHALEPRFQQELYLDVLWIAARALNETGAPEMEDLRNEILGEFFLIDQAVQDAEIKKRWAATPVIRSLVKMLGYEGFTGTSDYKPGGLEDDEIGVLQGLTLGKSEAEIAVDLSSTEEIIKQMVDEIFRKLEVDNLTEATQKLVREGIA